MWRMFFIKNNCGKKKYLTNPTNIYIIDKANANLYKKGGIAMKRTYQPNNRKRSKKQGFFARMRTNIINNRRRKGRKVLSH